MPAGMVGDWNLPHLETSCVSKDRDKSVEFAIDADLLEDFRAIELEAGVMVVRLCGRC